MKSYSRIVKYINKQPWAILPETLDAMIEVVERRLEGQQFTADEIRERIAAFERERTESFKSAGVAVLPMVGVISHRMTLMSQFSGGVSCQALAKSFRRAVGDKDVKAIVLDVDSPGGAVDGVPELAKEIRDARGGKPIVAVGNTLMASAAVWLSSGADEIVASPSADVGSIGVIARHIDFSKQNEMMGVNVTEVKAGRFKNEFSPEKPLDAEAVAHLQTRVDEVFDVFVKDVATGRGVSQKRVREDFGEGRLLSAQQALSVGLVDRIETLEQTVDRLLETSGKSRKRKAGDRTPGLDDVDAPTFTPDDKEKKSEAKDAQELADIEFIEMKQRLRERKAKKYLDRSA